MTKLLHLYDSQQLTANAEIVGSGSDARGAYLVLEQTVFHPQGGGQPADTGWINNSAVTFVGFVEDTVRHYGAFGPELTIGTTVCLKVDAEQRELAARLHTAGHLLAHAVERLCAGVHATKAFHFPSGPYVEFSATVPPSSNLVPLLDACLAEDVAKDLLIVLAQMHAPTDNDGPRGPQRQVSIGKYAAVPCGGTHVHSCAELGRVTVGKMKHKNGLLRVSYTVGAG